MCPAIRAQWTNSYSPLTLILLDPAAAVHVKAVCLESRRSRLRFPPEVDGVLCLRPPGLNFQSCVWRAASVLRSSPGPV